MAFVKIRVPRTSQPQDACGIDWSNPITKGLVVAFGPVGYYNLVPWRSKTSKPCEIGIAARYDAAGDDSTVYLQTPITLGANFTMFALAGATSVKTLAPPIWGLRGASASYALIYKVWGTANFGLFRTGADIASTIPFTTTGAQIPCVARLSNTSALDLFCNRVKYSTTNTFSSNTFDRIELLVKLGDLPSVGSSVGLGIAWDRALSDAELKSLTDNPWQIFEPEELTIWIPDEVGAGGPATVIPIGVQVTSAIGTPSAIGAAIAALSSVSATGSVGTPTAIGGTSIPATASPTGVSASVSVGVPVATGQAKALPTGVITSSSVGTPTATGAAKANPAGVQVTGYTGTPLGIGGSSIPATVLPSGVAGLSYVGTPTATGQSLADPLGVQANGSVGTPAVIAGGAAVAMPVGVQATSSVGVPTAIGASVAYPLGLSGSWSVGTPTAVAQVATPATTYPVGVSGQWFVGVPTAGASALVSNPLKVVYGYALDRTTTGSKLLRRAGYS